MGGQSERHRPPRQAYVQVNGKHLLKMSCRISIKKMKIRDILSIKISYISFKIEGCMFYVYMISVL